MKHVFFEEKKSEIIKLMAFCGSKREIVHRLLKLFLVAETYK